MKLKHLTEAVGKTLSDLSDIIQKITQIILNFDEGIKAGRIKLDDSVDKEFDALIETADGRTRAVVIDLSCRFPLDTELENLADPGWRKQAVKAWGTNAIMIGGTANRDDLVGHVNCIFNPLYFPDRFPTPIPKEIITKVLFAIQHEFGHLKHGDIEGDYSGIYEQHPAEIEANVHRLYDVFHDLHPVVQKIMSYDRLFRLARLHDTYWKHPVIRDQIINRLKEEGINL